MSTRILTCLFLCLGFHAAEAAAPPNIVWLSVEDISPHLGCYGDEHARTPNLDAFAKESILYENAFVCAPVCAPCRSSIITGVYPTSLGTHNMRSTVKLPPEIRPFTQYLRDAGYYCTNNSKQDYQFKTPEGTWDESSGKAHWKNRPDEKQPFFAVFNYTGTHESAVRGDQPKYDKILATLTPEERHDPASLELPPYYPDTPKVRADWARYYNCITAMDKWVAEKLAELDEAGLAENTIVFYWSDHGVGLPRGKRWLYDSGIKVPLIVRVPEKFRTNALPQPATEVAGSGVDGGVDAPPNQRLPSLAGGARTDELISLIDLPPTVLNLAGQAIPTYMQGRAFLGENLRPEREYIYAARDRMDERYDMIRCVRTKRYKYIRNYMPWRPYTQWISYAERGATMQELRRLHAEGKLTEKQELFFREEKPNVEIYDMLEDPYELNSLTRHNSSLEAWTIAKDLKWNLDLWQLRTVDVGFVPEKQLLAGAAYQVRRLPDYQTLRPYRPWEYDVYPPIRAADYDAIGGSRSTPRVPKIDNLHMDVNRWSVFCYGYVGAVKSPRYHKILDTESLSIRLAAAELISLRIPNDRARSVLLDALENAESPWDQLQAANVLDLLPDFDDHAGELRPVVERVRAKLKVEMKEGPAENRQGLGYVERCVVRLAERLGL